MAYFDFPIDELKVYKPERTEPKDFDAFWENTLNETRKAHLEVKFVKINNDLETIDTYDVEFNGFGGQPIKAWFSTPRNLLENCRVLLSILDMVAEGVSPSIG